MGTKAKAMISVDDPYLELVLNVHPLRPIRSVEEHQAAKKSLRSLAGDRREVAAEFKKVLISIIEVYERESGLQLRHLRRFCGEDCATPSRREANEHKYLCQGARHFPKRIVGHA